MGLRSDGVTVAWIFVASVTRMIGFEVTTRGLFWGGSPVSHEGSLATRPARSANPIW
jgi:hypothetical protein